MEPPPFFRFIWRTKKVANGVTTEYYYSGEQYTGMHTSDGKDVGAILDASGGLYGIYYDDSTIGTDVGQTYYFVYNGQGDVIGLYNHGGKLIATYAYDAWGRCIEAKAVTADDDGHAVTDPDHIAFINPFRYRGYYYDAESGLYYLNSRYYDPETGRFLNADGQLSTGSDLTGMNLFAYCGNNPVNRTDSSGEAWWHWVAAVAVVAVCAVAVVATAGGAAAGLAAVAAVGNGVAAATTASTVAAGAFIGSATALGMAAATAAVTSHNAQEFADQGGPALMSTATGAVLGGASGYITDKSQRSTSSSPGKGTQNPKVKAAVQRGQLKHSQASYGQGSIKEFSIPNSNCRVDAINFNTHTIYELKPNNPQAIIRGMKQLDRYVSAASQEYGGEWTGVLKLYD